jgi:hypothetical protein
MTRSRYLFVFFLFLVLIALAHGAAELQGSVDAKEKAQTPLRTGLHSTLYYRVIFTIWVSALLLIPALGFFLLLRPGSPGAYWRAFWTASYAAFVLHLLWTIGAMFHFNLYDIFHSQSGVAADPEKTVDNPGPDLFLFAWWTLDVVLAWTVSWEIPWVKFQRGAVHLLTFLMFFGATVLAPKAGVVAHLIGVAMAITVFICVTVLIVVRQSDPKSFAMRVFVWSFTTLNKIVPWHKLPTFIGVINLAALREVLRAQNLHNTSDIPVTRREGLEPTPPLQPEDLVRRNEDGYYNNFDRDANNNLIKPEMASSALNPQDETNSSDFTKANPGARFGRNIPLSAVGPLPSEKISEPNPRLISNELLARPDGKFTPATTLNLLAAAWIQFQTHDWFNHGTPVTGSEFNVDIPAGDKWHENPMRIRRTRPDPTRTDPTKPYPDGKAPDGIHPPTYVNAETHWWDGSEIYGSTSNAAHKLRKRRDGKLDVDEKKRLIREDLAAAGEQTGLTINWWIGLSLLHNLFSLEHNAICDHLLTAYSEWGDGSPENDEQLYRLARLVNAALMAKIHTVEWTPGILGTPALNIGMHANWWGLLSENVKKALGRISENESFSGIPGSLTNHHGADYCLTEEFTSVYRLHPLLPETFTLYSAETGGKLHDFVFNAPGEYPPEDPYCNPDDVVGPHARDHVLAHGTMTDVTYSFGITNPGAIVLRNFPTWMRRLKRLYQQKMDEVIDLGAIDVVRDRERGVPRYNRFRKLFHKPTFSSMDDLIRSSRQLSGDAELARKFRDIYRGDVEQVDLLVGMLAETPPPGFGFSDTAFRVFILMASRRIKSDRFLTTDFTPEVYTQAGIDWVENNGMVSVLLRHYPELAPSLHRVPNAFGPWKAVGG